MRVKINHTCPVCNFYIQTSVEKHINSCDGRGPRRKVQRSKRGGWNKGINYIDEFGLDWYNEYTNKLSNSVKYSYERGDRKEIDESSRREKISIKMKEVGGGYRIKSGRGKKGRYKGIWCDSSWELAWVIYNIDHGLNFQRNTDFFNYTFNDKIRKYYPDFKIGHKYIEIKGYFTDQFKAKIENFVDELEVIDKNGIKHFLDYVIGKYGKDFINLYD